MPKSVPNELLGGFYSYFANLSHSWPLMGCWLNHSVWGPFCLYNYLKTQKTDFWGAWKTLILTILWAQNCHTGVKNCAEHEFSTENLISPLFGVVRDLQNRQKSAIFKIGSKRLIQSFSADGSYASAHMAAELFQNTWLLVFNRNLQKKPARRGFGCHFPEKSGFGPISPISYSKPYMAQTAQKPFLPMLSLQ